MVIKEMLFKVIVRENKMKKCKRCEEWRGD